MACQAVLRLMNPTSVYQSATETCGPTAFCIDLCRHRPLMCTGALVNLATRGTARIDDLALAPSTDVRHRKSSETGGIAEADWIMLASVRSTLCDLAAYKAMQMFKGPLETFGIHPGALFEWLCNSGYGVVCLIGHNTLSDALFNKWVKRIRGGNQPIVAQLKGLAITPEALLRFFAERPKDESWSAFVIVKAQLSSSLREGTAAENARRQAQLDLVRSPRQPVGAGGLRPAFGQQALTSHADRITGMIGADSKLQRAREGLKRNADATHVMLLHDIEVGGFYVSCTVSNYGELMYHHSLPIKEFMNTINSVILATDRKA